MFGNLFEDSRGKIVGLRILISGVAVLLLGVHILVPSFKIDAASIALLILAILPWISSLIESVEFPGGYKVTLRDVQSATMKITPMDHIESESSAPEKDIPDQLDPRLSLVQLRIEIETRLRAIAQSHGIEGRKPLMPLFRELQLRGILRNPVLSGLQEVVVAGNKAAHGAEVEDDISDWAVEYGPQILAVLDEYI